MSMVGYRVAWRADTATSGSWGLWSNEQNRWFDVVFLTERETTATLTYLLAAKDRGNADLKTAD